jgi:hypothetical protein
LRGEASRRPKEGMVRERLGSRGLGGWLFIRECCSLVWDWRGGEMYDF